METQIHAEMTIVAPHERQRGSYSNFDLEVFICSCSTLTWWCVHKVCDEQSWSSAAEDSCSEHVPASIRAVTEVQYQANTNNGCCSCGSLTAFSSSVHCLSWGHYSHHHFPCNCRKHQCGSISCDCS